MQAPRSFIEVPSSASLHIVSLQVHPQLTNAKRKSMRRPQPTWERTIWTAKHGWLAAFLNSDRNGTAHSNALFSGPASKNQLGNLAETFPRNAFHGTLRARRIHTHSASSLSPSLYPFLPPLPSFSLSCQTSTLFSMTCLSRPPLPSPPPCYATTPSDAAPVPVPSGSSVPATPLRSQSAGPQ